MKLINAQTYRLEEFYNKIPPYVILSHTWEDDEILYEHMNQPIESLKEKKGWDKIEKTCQSAFLRGFEYAWVDTACIDKKSSAELSEAINSMFQWYQLSEICFVYLSAFELHIPRMSYYGEASQAARDPDVLNQFFNSRWWFRSWTLQELIAPRSLEFYSREWTLFGDKFEFSKEIYRRKGIKSTIQEIQRTTIAEKMSWAANRKCTRIEDHAYSLLGLFGINMPLLYGEGWNAFKRLQEEIIKTSIDHSIFIWEWNPLGTVGSSGDDELTLLAPSAAHFTMPVQIGTFMPSPYQMNNLGLNINLKVLYTDPHHSKNSTWSNAIGLFNCQAQGFDKGMVGIQLCIHDKSRIAYVRHPGRRSPHIRRCYSIGAKLLDGLSPSNLSLVICSRRALEIHFPELSHGDRMNDEIGGEAPVYDLQSYAYLRGSAKRTRPGSPKLSDKQERLQTTLHNGSTIELYLSRESVQGYLKVVDMFPCPLQELSAVDCRWRILLQDVDQNAESMIMLSVTLRHDDTYDCFVGVIRNTFFQHFPLPWYMLSRDFYLTKMADGVVYDSCGIPVCMEIDDSARYTVRVSFNLGVPNQKLDLVKQESKGHWTSPFAFQHF